jgi:hypothetical protein
MMHTVEWVKERMHLAAPLYKSYFVYGIDAIKPYIVISPRPSQTLKDSGSFIDSFVFDIVVISDSPPETAEILQTLYEAFEEVNQSVPIGGNRTVVGVETGERTIDVTDETGTVEGSFLLSLKVERPRRERK